MCGFNKAINFFNRVVKKDNAIFFTALIFSLGIALLLSYNILFFRGISFDGAFNTQAAINWYCGKGLTFNYEKMLYIQTGLPFQIINGFFLTTFGKSFLVSNLANLFFYWVFFAFLIILSKRENNILFLLGFICISILPSFQIYAFGGYGEFPALVLSVIGSFLIINYHDNRYYIAAGAIFIAFAIAIKWIFLLVIAPLMIILIIFTLKGKKDIVIISALAFIVTLGVAVILQYYPFDLFRIEYLFHSLIEQGTSTIYPDFPTRINSFYQSYVNDSGNWLIAPLKIFLISINFVFGLFLIYYGNNELFNRKRLYFFIFISLFATIYLYSWFILQEKNWYRRVFNSDILLILTICFLSDMFVEKKLKNYTHKISLGIILFFIVLFLSIQPFTLIECNKTPLENSLKTGLESLPEEYNGYGYGWWQAPRWSFLSGKEFQNIYSSNVLYDLFTNNTPTFLFIENENSLDPSSLKAVLDTYETKEVYSQKNYKIYEIIDFNTNNMQYYDSFNFTMGDYNNGLKGFWSYEKNNYRHSKIESCLFLDNINNYSYLYMEFFVASRLKNLELLIYAKSVENDSSLWYYIPIREGENLVYIHLPSTFKGQMKLYLFHINGVVAPDNGDVRMLGITMKNVSYAICPNDFNNELYAVVEGKENFKLMSVY